MILAPAWSFEDMTLTWHFECGDNKVGIVRFHEDRVPGPYYEVATVIVKDNRFEMVGYLTKREPSKRKHKAFYGYLKSLGYKRNKHDRAK